MNQESIITISIFGLVIAISFFAFVTTFQKCIKGWGFKPIGYLPGSSKFKWKKPGISTKAERVNLLIESIVWLDIFLLFTGLFLFFYQDILK